MQNDEGLHPGHHSIRLPNRDYSAPGFYFVTICSHEKSCSFGRVLDDRMEPSPLGKLVTECWIAIPSHFVLARLHTFVVMPNHAHGIIEIVSHDGARDSMARQATEVVPRVARGSLGAIVRSFKSAVTKRAREGLQWTGEVWQRNYFERVLRDGREFADAGVYIAGNVKRWARSVDGTHRAAPLQGS